MSFMVSWALLVALVLAIIANVKLFVLQKSTVSIFSSHAKAIEDVRADMRNRALKENAIMVQRPIVVPDGPPVQRMIYVVEEDIQKSSSKILQREPAAEVLYAKAVPEAVHTVPEAVHTLETVQTPEADAAPEPVQVQTPEPDAKKIVKARKSVARKRREELELSSLE